jgi:hypothetical protein
MSAPTSPVLHVTREEWLNSAIDAVRPMFTEAGYPIPQRVRVSVGWGYGAYAESKFILGQTWATVTSADFVPAVFISPAIDDADIALGVLLHELVHVVDDCKNGHRGDFVTIARAVGLEGKPTQAFPGVALQASIITITETLGHYPHAALNVNAVGTDDPSKPGTKVRVHTGPGRQTHRTYKAVCMNAECEALGYLGRHSRHWLNVATPICPVCRTDMVVTR